MTPILKQSWNLSELSIKVLGGAFYFGLFFGAILCGFLADKYGRRKVEI